MNIEKQIEFDKIQEIWAEQAYTEGAVLNIKNRKVFLEEAELKKELRDTTNARELIEKLGNPPLQNVTEMQEIMQIAQRGDCLSPYQLERVEKVLVVTQRLRDYLRRGKEFENPLAYYDENLDGMEDLREEISRQIRCEAVDDRASRALYEIRYQITRMEDGMKQKAEQVIRNNKECMADTYYTQRNGRVCVPVKKEYKFRIQGSVIDKSSTGSTLFIEPLGVQKQFEELQLLRIEEENEVHRILYTLTAMVSDCIPSMEENVRMIEKLDFLFSKGKLSLLLDCTEPVINTDRSITLRGARHPLMDKEINVPLDFTMGDGTRGIVITGPNTGGKTVAIKTVMLCCYMAQCGLHVTCKEANICMNSTYLCDIGDGQNLSENLSTFSAHIKNVLEILRQVGRDSFVIMDELGSGTDPAEGMGIAVAILEELRKSECNFLVTTHYPEIKEYAEKAEHVINARMTFDKETLLPTYQMMIGEAGESCAFYIADRLGMPAEMLKVAVEAAYGKDAVKEYQFHAKDQLEKSSQTKVRKEKRFHADPQLAEKFQIGDSVMVYPDKKIGIVCEKVNEQGVLRVQVADRKIWINHKRVKLHVKAQELYPEDYDFSIIFDSVKNRKVRHDMDRKYTEETIEYENEAESKNRR
ncbi:MAG: DNA mismatch repair protein MutS [Lachnospiraceae bacterium]|nr:DNA mismatch repair protein MutS [Lachnospiraceae bacterium]